MTVTIKSLRPVGRRDAIKTVGALVAGAAVTANWKRSFAQAQKTIRHWTTQVAPTQITAWEEINRRFEKEYPNIKVELSKANTSDIQPRLVAAFASGEQPEVCSGGNAVFVATFHRLGRTENMADVVKSVGDLHPRMVDCYNDGGYQFGLGLGLTVISTMWYRTDLLKEAGRDVPKNWDELVATAKAITKGSQFGVSLPYGKGLFTTQIVDMFTRQAGGDIIAPDGSVVYNSPAAVRALEFLREIRPYAPVAANNYSYPEALNAFCVGQAGIGMYTGRVLVTVRDLNPKIDDHIQADFYPYPTGGTPHWTCGFDPLYITKGGKVQTEEAKIYINFFYRPDNYLTWVESAPGHMLPVVKRTSEMKAFKENPILSKHAKSITKMLEISEKAGTDLKPTPKHPVEVKLGPVHNSYVLASALQKVVVDKEDPKAVVAWAHDEIAKIVKG
ncbi:MAG: extracellular solute-binding protein [Rhodospirillales bacterium]|nr:extracellular solute-binding protein [Rhodospirillales bacterium]